MAKKRAKEGTGKKEKSQKSGNGQSSSLNKDIYKYFLNHQGKQFTRKEVMKRFARDASKEEVFEALEKLISKGDVEVLRNQRLKASASRKSTETAHTVEGIVDMTSSGNAYIISEKAAHDIYVPQKRMNGAFHGDKVKVAIYSQSRKRRPEGEVVEVIKRSREEFIGVIEMSENYAFLNTGKRNLPDIFIPLDKLQGGKQGEKAVAKVVQWPQDKKNPVGEIIKVLGPVGVHDVEMQSILLNNRFPLHFSEKALAEAEAISDKITEEEIEKRRDFRDITTFTIDPHDAKDFDDALSFRLLDDGNFEIGVHIADVAHYVKPGTQLDKEAYERATSVYLVDRVLPMLPERLSNNLCSLRPNEDKLCFAAVFTMNEQADVLGSWIGRTIINSDRRFAYEEAQEVLDSGMGDYAEELKVLNTLAGELRRKRFAKGSIDFDSLEFRFKLDENNHPVEIYIKDRKEANLLIEDFMLLANKVVASHVSQARKGKHVYPLVYRVHDEPDPVKLEVFAGFVRKFGYTLKFSTAAQVAESMNILMEKIKGRREENILEQLAIRTMAKAYYSTKNIGHYGLGFEHYSHFTSPIRRYPDVMVHRVVEDFLADRRPDESRSEMEEHCQHVSLKERDAVSAERESVKYKQVEYLQDRIGQEFEGIIAGIIPRGMFIEIIENRCEGFVGIGSLDSEDYVFDDENLQFFSITTGKTFQLGNQVRIRVEETDLSTRTAYFEII